MLNPHNLYWPLVLTNSFTHTHYWQQRSKCTSYHTHTHTHTHTRVSDGHMSKTDTQINTHCTKRERERDTHIHTDFSHTHYLCNRSNFSASNLSSSGRSHVHLLFTSEEHKRAGSWCKRHWCHTCQPWSWLQRQSHRLTVLMAVFKKKLRLSNINFFGNQPKINWKFATS